ncbi:putative sporulation protein (polysaccharide deacetylase family) [Peribacillus deserti]|uniref:Sporulation protein (Polysaccharide deacetylase family) n=1 Tax=Peribacillus deserti TaxID=673318 RepID=A0ABS2QNB7_9BACI|nr:polysaccharide deacetylase family protein [Peribacillus deserti]MBM7694657.1 putative sporulation protein (polysaccharide deacetylase family) [Peribacillus deserti]
MNSKFQHFIALSLIAGISWILVQNPLTDSFVQGLNNKPEHAEMAVSRLYAEIQDKAPKFEIPAQDARIDSVWKTVPGYNGLKVDLDASYKIMKKTGKFDSKKLIYKQVPPAKHLKDLPPAPIYRANTEKPAVSLLINVAWGNEYLQDMLTVLKKNDVKATFFLEGRWAKKFPELAKMINESGHEIGNHSYSHPDMKLISDARANEEIKKTNEIIKAVTGVTCRWFAPPSGSYKEETVNIASANKMGTIMWSVDTVDWQKPSPEVLTERVLSKLHPGAFILMHPTESSARSLDKLIKSIKAENLHLMTVSQSLSEDRIMH